MVRDGSHRNEEEREAELEGGFQMNEAGKIEAETQTTGVILRECVWTRMLKGRPNLRPSNPEGGGGQSGRAPTPTAKEQKVRPQGNEEKGCQAEQGARAAMRGGHGRAVGLPPEPGPTSPWRAASLPFQDR